MIKERSFWSRNQGYEYTRTLTRWNYSQSQRIAFLNDRCSLCGNIQPLDNLFNSEKGSEKCTKQVDQVQIICINDKRVQRI